MSGDKILGGDEYLVGEEDLVLLCCEGDVKEREVIGSSSVLVRVRLEVLVEGVNSVADVLSLVDMAGISNCWRYFIGTRYILPFSSALQ